MDFIEAGLTLKRKTLMIILKNVYYHLPRKYFFTSLLFDCLVLVFIDLRPILLSRIENLIEDQKFDPAFFYHQS